MARQRPPSLIMLVVTVVLEAFLELSTQPALLLHDAASLLQRLSPPLVDGLKADHTLALVIVKQLVLVLHDLPVPGPRGGHEQVVEGVGKGGSPCGRGGHGQVLCVAAAVPTDKGEDDEGEGDVEDGGEEERHEDGLEVLAVVLLDVRVSMAHALTLKCEKPAMVYLCSAE
jgi:hypothetical protein